MADLGQLQDLVPLQIWDGVVGRVVTGENAALVVVEMEPGAVVPEHHHVNEQLGVVVTGTVRFTAGGETRDLGPGGTWRLLAHAPHDVVAGDEGATLVEAFAPPRADWAGLTTLEGRAPRWPA